MQPLLSLLLWVLLVVYCFGFDFGVVLLSALLWIEGVFGLIASEWFGFVCGLICRVGWCVYLGCWVVFCCYTWFRLVLFGILDFVYYRLVVLRLC